MLNGLQVTRHNCAKYLPVTCGNAQGYSMLVAVDLSTLIAAVRHFGILVIACVVWTTIFMVSSKCVTVEVFHSWVH